MNTFDKCDYLTIILDSHWGLDVFEHPKYRYFCHKDGKMMPVPPHIRCKNCEDYSDTKKKVVCNK